MEDIKLSMNARNMAAAIGAPSEATNPDLIHSVSDADLCGYITEGLKLLWRKRPIPSAFADPILDHVIAWKRELLRRGCAIDLNTIYETNTRQAESK